MPRTKVINLEITDINDGKHNPAVKGEMTALYDFQWLGPNWEADLFLGMMVVT